MNDLLPKLGPNIEISGIPYDTILLANKKSENQEDARDGDVEYERLDIASHDKLIQCTNTFEEDLKMYLMMRKEMPLQIQAAFLQKLQFISQSLEDGDEGCEESEEKILEKLIAFENSFSNDIHSQKIFRDMIEDLSHDLSKYSHLEKVLIWI